MLAVITLGFIQLTLNWFDIASAFGAVGVQFHLQIPQLALLISLFLAGYGIFHIPTGFLASRFGLRNLALAGILIESLAGIGSGLAPDYAWLAVMRIIAGIGGSFFVGSGFALVTSWFRNKELALAQGVAGGAGFSIGAALGLFTWAGLVASDGWQSAMYIGGGIGLVVFIICVIALKTPKVEQAKLAAGNLDWSSVGRVLTNRNLWLFGLSTLGAYGAYFTASQLLAGYAAQVFSLAPTLAALMAAVMVLAGIPGSVIGGFFSDRSKNLKAFILVPLFLLGLCLILVPFAGPVMVWVLAFLIGGLLIFQFASFTSIPGAYGDEINPQDVATAEGLLLTILAVGGFLVPIGFGQLVVGSGYTGAWVYLGVVTLVFALIGLLAREPSHHAAQMATERGGSAGEDRHI